MRKEELRGLLGQAFKMLDEKRPFEAKGLFESLLPHLDAPAERGIISYNLGALTRSSLGDGLQARNFFQQAVPALKADSGNTPEAREMQANAFENLMLLSLSYEEYESWAVQLRAIRLDEPILLDQYPTVEGFKQRGLPWSDVLGMIACSYYSRDPGRVDPGLYGEAAATYHLILANRRALRLKREEWAQAIVEYTALCIRLGNDTLNSASRYYPLLNPRPYLPIGAAAKAFIKEYLLSNPTDRAILKMQDSMRAWATGIEDYAQVLDNRPVSPMKPVICRCGKEMDIFKDGEIGILLATCSADGIVRQIPEILYRVDATRRAANKYQRFES